MVSCLVFSNTAFSAPWVNLKLTYDFAVHNYNAEAVYIKINGNPLEDLPMPPIIMNNMTLVPAREVLEPLGAVVDWKKDTEELFIAYEDSIAIAKIGSKTVNCNGVNKELELAPKIINNKTMVPVRFVSEIFDFKVEWVNSERTIYITSPEPVSVEPITEVTTLIPQTEVTVLTTSQPLSEAITEATTLLNSSSKGEVEISNPFFKADKTAQAEVTEITTEATTAVTASKEMDFDENIYYDRNIQNLAILSSCVSNGIEGIAQEFDETEKKQYFSFSLTAGNKMDSGFFDINDDLISQVQVSGGNQRVTICFNANTEVDYKIYENGGYIYIKPYV